MLYRRADLNLHIKTTVFISDYGFLAKAGPVVVRTADICVYWLSLSIILKNGAVE
jgi:hypothetical protein